MKLNLTIDDRTYEQYESRFGTPKLYKKLKDAIEFFADVPEEDRLIVLYGEDRKKIEKIFQTTFATGAELAKNIEKLNRVKIEGLFMTFDPEELARIDMQASFHGRTRQVFIMEMIQEIKDRMLEKV